MYVFNTTFWELRINSIASKLLYNNFCFSFSARLFFSWKNLVVNFIYFLRSFPLFAFQPTINDCNWLFYDVFLTHLVSILERIRFFFQKKIKFTLINFSFIIRVCVCIYVCMCMCVSRFVCVLWLYFTHFFAFIFFFRIMHRIPWFVVASIILSLPRICTNRF